MFRSNAQTLLTKDGVITQAEDGSSLREGYRNSSDGTINGITKLELEKQQEKARRRDRRNATPLRELQVGTKIEGLVHNTVRHGVYVDIGAKADGLVHLRDMSVDFVHEVEDIVRPGDKLTVWIKYVDPVANVLALTMLPPALGFEGPHTAIKDVKLGARVTGVVQRVTNFGAYIDAGFERHAWIHVRKFWGRQPCETLQGLKLGQKVYAQVVDVDEVRSYVSLTARGRGGVKLSEGVAIEIDGEDLKFSYGDASTDRQPTVRLDQDDIRARATLRVGEGLDDGFETGSVRLTSDDGEGDDEVDEDDESVVEFVQSEMGDSVVDQGIDVEGLAVQFKAEDDEDEDGEDNDDSDFDDDDEFAFAEEMDLMGDTDTEEADYSEIAHMLTDNTEFIGLESSEIVKLKQFKRRIETESSDGNDDGE